MNNSQLQDIASILRRDVLKMTTRAGSGHPTSCLSCAEIMACLFFNQMQFDTGDANNPDNDEFILSKGHAAPILYSSLFRSRCTKNNLMALRKIDSVLEGHPKPQKGLSWIKVGTGSLGQGLSIGVGYAIAAKLQKRKFKTYVLMGDSEMAEGSVYESMELAVKNKLDNLIAIVDVNRLGQRGETMLGHNVIAYKKRFNGFGWQALIVNGHSIKQILSALKKAKKSKKPVIIIAKTFKGKGVNFLEDKEGKHGKTLDERDLIRALGELPDPAIPKINIQKPKKINYKIYKKDFKKIKYYLGEKKSTREAYGDAVAELTLSNSHILVIDGEVSNSTYSEKVKNKTPKQFIEAYIAEQNMVGMAQGLSVKGFNVFVSSFAAFLTRAHDQIRMAGISSSNLTFCGSHVGVAIGEDGPSQMGLEDISMFRTLPKSIIFSPCDAVSTFKLTQECSKFIGIKYIRTTRDKNTEVLYKNNEKFALGDFKILKQSKKDRVVIIGSGTTVHEALKAQEKLQNVAVIDIYCIRPFNSEKLINFINKHGKKAIIVEDHYEAGGIGEMLGEFLVNTKIKVKHLCIKKLPRSGKPEQLLEKFGISSKKIIEAVKRLR